MKTIVDLANLAAVSTATADELRGRHVRVLALFFAASRHGSVEWQEKGTTIALLSYGGNDYSVNVDGVRSKSGSIAALIETVEQLSSAFAAPPTATARDYGEWHGIWVDVQDDRLVSYPKYTDGGWEEQVVEVEFTCQHLLDRVNNDFGTEFTMDDFEEGDECDECTRARLKL